ncbi:uncharacterized protein [Oryza sativa Japonica Group]|uniref:uncharacterized protein isoform X3 n=1 Tax=Oryza sativa subsp. japonica TaxID=39947 RepID=UPI00339CC8C2
MTHNPLLAMGHTLLSDLSLGDDNERICVRVSRFWAFCDQKDDDKILHFGLVLIDEKGTSIAAQIYPPCDEIFRPIITEGKVYYIKYFRVRKCNRQYKPVDNCMSIYFTRWTKLEERVDPPAEIPLYTYSLSPFGGLRSRVGKKDSFTDIIGIITQLSPVTPLQGTVKRSVFIRNTDNAILNVALWGERATSFPADEVFVAGQKEPQIVIFVGTLVKGYGDVSLSGNSACKWYINADTPEVISLRNSI